MFKVLDSKRQYVWRWQTQHVLAYTQWHFEFRESAPPSLIILVAALVHWDLLWCALTNVQTVWRRVRRRVFRDLFTTDQSIGALVRGRLSQHATAIARGIKTWCVRRPCEPMLDTECHCSRQRPLRRIPFLLAVSNGGGVCVNLT